MGIVVRPQLVIVEWEDAYSNSAWHQNTEIDTDFDDGGYDCVTVGYLIREDKDRVILAARVSFKNESYGLLQRIPRGMVRNIRTLTEPSDEGTA